MADTTVVNSIKKEEPLAELKINIMNGKDFRNARFFGKMSPYIVIEYRNLQYKTDEDDNGHTEPIWNEKIDIPIYSFDEEIKIDCIDPGIIFDELICSTVM